MKMYKILSSVLIVALILPSLLWAENKDPQASVELLLGEIRQIESGEKEKHSQLALSLLNVSEISKKTLGKYWAKRSDPEREKFQTLLGDLFVYVAFPSSAKFFAKLDMVYGKTKEKKQKVVVPLTVVHEREGEVGIDFHLIKTGDKWQVVDVVLDGASMRNNLRNKFYKTIAKKGFDALLLTMEKKLEAKKS
ncbi:MAG: ABC transporter substrate-binding protein [Nitrospina sp.]|jgi:phospholipid transport system substrate-binding protein|nr:ABC transporter substrate-binding protein [Nitrospina sp.]MBT5633069.1 ABC transporter substrate-binding protein [Nitrospina sp.]